MATNRDIIFTVKMRNQTTRALKGLGKNINEVGKAADNLDTAADNAGTSVDKAGKKSTKAGKRFNLFGRSILSLNGALKELKGVAATVFAGLTINTALRDFASFEEGLIAVGKTSDISGKELEAFGKEIQALAPRLAGSSQDLLSIAAAAAQLGVTGSDNLLKFVDTISRLEVASDIGGQEAALALTRILNLTKDGIGDIDRFASAIVSLGNDFETSESKIVSIAADLARGISQFGVASADVAAISTALASVGVQAELGGSAVGRTFRTLDEIIFRGGESAKNLSTLTGLAVQDLQKAFGEDPVRVFRLFVEGLQNVNRAGGNASQTLALFGLRGDEINKVIIPLSTRAENLAKALAQAGDEFRNPLALIKESETALTSLTQVFRNTIDALAVVSQNIVAQFAPAIKSALNSLTQILSALGRNEEAIKLVANAILGLVSAITTLLAFKLAGKLFAIAKGFSLAATATKVWNATLKANPLGVLVGTISAAVGLLVTFKDRTIDLGNTQVKIVNVLSSLWTQFADIIQAAINFDLDGIRRGARNIANITTAVVTNFRNTFKTVGEDIKENFEVEYVNSVQRFATTSKNIILEDLGGVFTDVGALASNLFNQIPQDARKALNLARDTLQSITGTVVSNDNNRSKSNIPQPPPTKKGGLLDGLLGGQDADRAEAAKRLQQIIKDTRTAQEQYNESLKELQGLRAYATTAQEIEAIDRAIRRLEESKGSINGLGNDVKTFEDVVKSAQKNGIEALQDSVTEFARTGKLSFQSFADFGQAVLADLVSAIFSFRSESGGIFSGINGQSIGGGSNSGFFSGLQSLASDLFHTGGVIGKDAAYSSRVVNPRIFKGAKKFHGGGMIGGDEKPIIAKTGETVLTPGQMDFLANRSAESQGSGLVINQNLNISTGVEQTVAIEFQKLMPQIKEASVQAVGQAQRRGVI